MSQDYKMIISLMSGTSIDEIDAVAVKIFDDLHFEIVESNSIKYPPNVRNIVFDAACNKATTSQICALNFILGELFAKAVLELIKKINIPKYDVDFVVSHGQTVWHIPQKIKIDGIKTGATLQLGDISVISERTGIMTIGDFRPKDIAAGGQGAPLVPFADELIFGREERRGILNIGGISNITVLSPDVDTFAFDIGPGNMLIDYFAQKFFQVPYDKDGALAAKGNIDEKLLRFMMELEYYKAPPPKSTGREMFSAQYAEEVYKHALKIPHNILATVTAQCAYAVFEAYTKFIQPRTILNEIVLGGGGAYNKTLKNYLQKLMPKIKFTTHEDYKIGNKQKEALAFAYLGYMTYQNKCNNLPGATGANYSVSMGKISY